MILDILLGGDNDIGHLVGQNTNDAVKSFNQHDLMQLTNTNDANNAVKSFSHQHGPLLLKALQNSAPETMRKIGVCSTSTPPLHTEAESNYHARLHLFVTVKNHKNEKQIADNACTFIKSKIKKEP